MTIGEMTTIQFFRSRPKRCREYCINLCRLLTYWLCAQLGIAVLAAGSRAIPMGHFDFDPALAKRLGGRDAVAKSIIYQKLLNWLVFNESRGRNIKDGRAWTFNSGRAWAADLDLLWHEETVKKHLRDLEQLGLLDSKAMRADRGDQTKWYTTKDCDGHSQMLLWPESNAAVSAAKGFDDSSIQKTSITQSAKSKRNNSSRARKPISAGVVAEFPNHIPNSDMPERKADIPEQRPESDEHEQYVDISKLPTIPGVYSPPPIPHSPSPTGDEPTDADTKPSEDTEPIDVPAWMSGFFTGCTEAELGGLLNIFGEQMLLDARHYAVNPDHHIDNPAGFVRAQLAKGWRPPAGQGSTKLKEPDGALDSFAELGSASTDQLRWIVSDECQFMWTFKQDAQRILDERERVGA